MSVQYTTPYRCTECGQAVELAKDRTTRRLLATCACDSSRAVKIATKTPQEWSPDE